MAESMPPRPPASILFIKPDTLGDLVLFSASLKALRTTWPNTRMGVVIRSAYMEIARIIAPEIDWLGTEIDTFRQSPSEASISAAQLAQRVIDWQPECLVAACPRRNWMDFYLGAKIRASRCVAFASTDYDPYFGAQLRRELPAAVSSLFTETAPDRSDEPEWRRGFALAEYLAGHPLPSIRPKITLSDDLQAKADAILESLGLSPSCFAVCASAGFANVAIKTWSAEKYAASIKWLNRVHQCPTLLIGHNDERSYLESVASAAKPAEPKIWTGGAGDIPVLAALIASSRLYFGNDTGAMHFAAATDRPVIAVFGGGTWPRFIPAASQSISLVQPLPCFSCGWDCPWGDAPCLKAIGVDAMTKALDHIWKSDAAPFQIVQEVNTISDETARFMGKGASQAKKLAAEHLSRLLKLEEIAALAAEKDLEICSLKNAANEKQDEIVALKGEATKKDVEIKSLKQMADGKDSEISRLKLAADEKDGEITAIKTAADIRLRDNLEKESEIRMLKRTCDERLVQLNAAADAIRIFTTERETLKTEIEAVRTAEIHARKQAEEIESFYKRLAPNAAEWASQLQDAHARIASLEADVHARAAEIAALKNTLAERECSLQNYFHQHGSLEVNKHYQRLLREKEDVLQMLHRACQEREATIRRLVAEANAGTRGLRSLSLGIAAWWGAHIRTPWNDWSRRKILDGYWMQLGGLFQYEPRTLCWDGSVRSAHCLKNKSPRIGLVTPSFNQEVFLQRTISSVLDQAYPNIKYVIQDGGSGDGSRALIEAHASNLHAWESAPDKGQADAIRRGFDKLTNDLTPDDIMAWLNSDDLLAPGALHWVGRYFARHPNVDVIYGHRIIVDEADREVGRWVLPPHNPETLRWIDFIPQETMFWRKRAWDHVGGLDPSFHFALDWDLALRFQEAGLKIVRVPRFLGAFRVHAQQKTSAQIHTRGQEEMNRVRRRLHGPSPDLSRLDHETRRAQLDGAFFSRLLDFGIRL